MILAIGQIMSCIRAGEFSGRCKCMSKCGQHGSQQRCVVCNAAATTRILLERLAAKLHRKS
jgi:hypothetical protein